MGDSHGALAGQFCFESGMGKATYGTGSSMMVNIGDRPLPAPAGLVTSVGFAAEGRVFYAFEGNIHSTGGTIKWLEDELGLIRSAAESETLATSVADNGGVYLVPAFAGLGAPWWDSEAKALICGMSRGTNRAHIARAALESIAYQVKDLIDLIVAAGVLSLLYWLGNIAEGGLPSPATSPPTVALTTPPPTEEPTQPSDVQTQAPGAITEVPIATAEPTESPTPTPSPTPSSTPLPANMQQGAKPSLSSEHYVPSAKQIISWREGNMVSSRLTGDLQVGLICERDLSDDIPVGDTYVYYLDDQNNVRWSRLGEQDVGVIYLPADCSVGTVWTSGQGRPQEVVAVDYDATLGGVRYENCIVVKEGDRYRFFVPGTGLHTIRSSLDEDMGVLYEVIEQKGTNIELEDYEIAVG
jgi:hypothetical protein